MTTHKLKTWPDLYMAILEGRKTFEVRNNDRGFKIGDILELQEFRPTKDAKSGQFTGRSLLVDVIYLTDFAQQPGYVVMSIRRHYAATYSEG